MARGLRLRRSAAALAFAALAAAMLPGHAAATNYDGTNPGATACGDGSHPVDIIDTAYITYNGATIGRVELRQSTYCATVWARVYNQTASSIQARETIIVYTDPNGSGATSYTSTDTLGASGGSGWSNQYNDRPSSRAKGELYYAGGWRTAQTGLSPAWSQNISNMPSLPYSCQHTSSYPCERWAVYSPGVSEHYGYNVSPDIGSMPSGSGTYDARPDVSYMFDQYNGLSGVPNPFFDPVGVDEDPAVLVYAYEEQPSGGLIAIARGGAYAEPTSNHVFVWGELKMNTLYTNWGPATDTRKILCHEIGHVQGLAHITVSANGVSVQGSHATCMGTQSATGPYGDDVMALNSIYRSSAP